MPTRDVGVVGACSDWPANVTYYANCFDRRLREGIGPVTPGLDPRHGQRR